MDATCNPFKHLLHRQSLWHSEGMAWSENAVPTEAMAIVHAVWNPVQHVHACMHEQGHCTY